MSFVARRRDCHEEMNGPCFENWLEGGPQKLQSARVIVMDNASNHSPHNEAVATTNCLKVTITEWLGCKNIQYGPGLSKKHLHNIGGRVKQRSISYKVKPTKQSLSCKCGRLYRAEAASLHFGLDPIELIWAQVKSAVAAGSTTFNITHVEQLLK
ncbi:hypothetical protein HPB48_000183 [Haemaphysalis longicornis]|uniref:Uncharacterized protein n=1 Tax=Haemaphysalis longicornis TaxID=44386 RepID=A0A9J6G844_HAELO|nr:hypothetical protein HPB48_000183 [Haemaphysalis longicornis]